VEYVNIQPMGNEESYASIKNEEIIDENIYLKYLQYECKCFWVLFAL
jgi:hypothetical protein